MKENVSIFAVPFPIYIYDVIDMEIITEPYSQINGSTSSIKIFQTHSTVKSAQFSPIKPTILCDQLIMLLKWQLNLSFGSNKMPRFLINLI